jgi:hypothetical protein
LINTLQIPDQSRNNVLIDEHLHALLHEVGMIGRFSNLLAQKWSASITLSSLPDQEVSYAHLIKNLNPSVESLTELIESIKEIILTGINFPTNVQVQQPMDFVAIYANKKNTRPVRITKDDFNQLLELLQLEDKSKDNTWINSGLHQLLIDTSTTQDAQSLALIWEEVIDKKRDPKEIPYSNILLTKLKNHNLPRLIILIEIIGGMAIKERK